MDVQLPLLPCFSMCVSGQTVSGKNTWGNIVLFHQLLFDEMESDIPNLTFHKGLPTPELIETFAADRRHRLIVLDDLMHSVVENADMELFFTQGCHHRRISVIFLTQNLFPKGAKARTIALNTYYIVLMKNVRSGSKVSTLGKQLFPGNARLLSTAYKYATNYPYGCLIVDASPHAEDKYRLRTHIFPGEDLIVYSKEKPRPRNRSPRWVNSLETRNSYSNYFLTPPKTNEKHCWRH